MRAGGQRHRAARSAPFSGRLATLLGPVLASVQVVVLTTVLSMVLVAPPGAVSIARAEEVPVNLRAAILMRALGYERRLAGGDGTIRLIVVSPEDGDGRREATEMARAFMALSQRLRVSDRPVRVTLLVTDDRDAAVRTVRARGAEVVYLARGMRLGREGAALARQGHLLLCGNPEAIAQGCVLGVELAQGRSRLVVHLSRARAGSFRFDGRLLRLARVIR